MNIKIIDFEKNETVSLTLDGKSLDLNIDDYELTEYGKKTLFIHDYEDWQVDHIAKTLKELMLDSEYEKNKNGQVEDKSPTLEKEIKAVCDEMAAFLIEKNKAYGNSAADPVGIFAKRLNPLDQIDVRIDDKLNRLQKGHEYPGDDTIVDLAGYLILRMIVAKSAQ